MAKAWRGIAAAEILQLIRNLGCRIADPHEKVKIQLPYLYVFRMTASLRRARLRRMSPYAPPRRTVSLQADFARLRRQPGG
jgi:hypothetical protein